MRIAVLVKQVPKFEEMELGPDGRLRRDGIEPEMNPYCRRAVSKAVELAAERLGSRVVVFTLGPPAADDTLREAIAWGLERDVDIEGVHVTDAAFAGSDTLATAKALLAMKRRMIGRDNRMNDLSSPESCVLSPELARHHSGLRTQDSALFYCFLIGIRGAASGCSIIVVRRPFWIGSFV